MYMLPRVSFFHEVVFSTSWCLFSLREVCEFLCSLYNTMDSCTRLKKVCPQCNSSVHVKRSVCDSGFAFPLKRKVHCTSDTGKLQAVKRSRVSESEERAILKKDRDRIHKACMRASETCEQTLHRQKHDRVRKMNMRASETCEQTLHRQEQNRSHMVSMRASETPDEIQRRKHSNKEAMTNKRKKDVSLEHAIGAFHSQVKFGPNFVCTCCHRLMYRKTVILCNKVSYTKANTSVLQQVFSDDIRYISSNREEWIYKTCDKALKRGSMPLQAIARHMKAN